MNEEPEPMAYIARKACGCFVFAGVDMPNARASNAKEIAWAMRKGYAIDRVTCQFVRDNWRSSCDVCAPRLAQTDAQQEAMQL